MGERMFEETQRRESLRMGKFNPSTVGNAGLPALAIQPCSRYMSEPMSKSGSTVQVQVHKSMLKGAKERLDDMPSVEI